jgi:type IV pilus assembly protein PilX
MRTSKTRFSRRAGTQRGMVLFVALIVLIVMTLAGLALLRQLGVGTSIAGNVAFKEAATAVADRGVEEALQWLGLPATNNSLTSPANGYDSSWVAGFDPSAYPWGPGFSRAIVPPLPAALDFAQTGSQTDMIIQRLCVTPNMSSLDPAQRCSDSLIPNPLRSHGGGGYGSVLPSTTPAPFYRVTTRVRGPRNTVSVTQAVIQ